LNWDSGKSCSRILLLTFLISSYFKGFRNAFRGFLEKKQGLRDNGIQIPRSGDLGKKTVLVGIVVLESMVCVRQRGKIGLRGV